MKTFIYRNREWLIPSFVIVFFVVTFILAVVLIAPHPINAGLSSGITPLTPITAREVGQSVHSSTSTPISLLNRDYSFAIGTNTVASKLGNATLAVYGTTTIQTPVNTDTAFLILNRATTSAFQVGTIGPSVGVATSNPGAMFSVNGDSLVSGLLTVSSLMATSSIATKTGVGVSTDTPATEFSATGGATTTLSLSTTVGGGCIQLTATNGRPARVYAGFASATQAVSLVVEMGTCK